MLSELDKITNTDFLNADCNKTKAKPPKILIIDDDSSVVELLKINLESSGYQVNYIYDGKTALEIIEKEKYDLIILDIMLPEVNGYRICQYLRRKRTNFFTPIIILSAKDKLFDKMKGLRLGADDYISKPFDVQELVIKVDAILKRTMHILSANPLTYLPGNASIVQEVNSRLNNDEKFAFAYIDINNFKAYNDRYGFNKGDRVIKYVADSLRRIVRCNEFIGHIGGDDFVLISKPEYAETNCRKIIELFDNVVEKFYSLEDAKKGCIVEKNRLGKKQKFKLMSLSIGIVTNENINVRHYGEIVELATETKMFAKLDGKGRKSCYIFNRRKNIKDLEYAKQQTKNISS